MSTVDTLCLCICTYRGVSVPEPPEGHQWKSVQHDNKARILPTLLCKTLQDCALHLFQRPCQALHDPPFPSPLTIVNSFLCPSFYLPPLPPSSPSDLLLQVTWLASWTENIQGAIKYVMLNPTSKIKGEKDWQKYETSRKLKTKVDDLRTQYAEDWKSKEMKVRQMLVFFSLTGLTYTVFSLANVIIFIKYM